MQFSGMDIISGRSQPAMQPSLSVDLFSIEGPTIHRICVYRNTLDASEWPEAADTFEHFRTR